MVSCTQQSWNFRCNQIHIYINIVYSMYIYAMYLYVNVHIMYIHVYTMYVHYLRIHSMKCFGISNGSYVAEQAACLAMYAGSKNINGSN
jgi:hypothetical protein